MTLEFGNLGSKADAIAEAKRKKQFERDVAAVLNSWRVTDKLPRHYAVRKWGEAAVAEAERRAKERNERPHRG